MHMAKVRKLEMKQYTVRNRKRILNRRQFNSFNIVLCPNVHRSVPGLASADLFSFFFSKFSGASGAGRIVRFLVK